MILTWIALGIAAGAAAATIITYWNEIVDWAKEIFNKLFSKGKLFMEWVGGNLRTWVAGRDKDGEYSVGPDKKRPANEKELWQMYEAGIITKPELEDLLNGRTVYTDVH